MKGNSAYASKSCTKCGYVKEDFTLSDRIFVFPDCVL
ncbi:hypothetical protein IOK49_06215 [Fervidicoccus fontis]|uniref:Transposase n=1 Tax=Fervidicoccus fontis TaxID=683846 RepID=A0A7C2ZAY5_9CREN|nr:hypothetical protein [Fervidicoccus fontis]HEW64375.1 hypothetical protein [Fervidicoccus fontis]